MGRASSATRNKPHGSCGGTEPPSRGVVQASAKRLRPGCGPECCRQAQAAVVCNSSNKIHQTWPKPSSREFHQERRGQSRGREGFPFADWVKKLGAPPPRSAPPPYVRPRPPTTESGRRQQVAEHAAGCGDGGSAVGESEGAGEAAACVVVGKGSFRKSWVSRCAYVQRLVGEMSKMRFPLSEDETVWDNLK